MYWLCLTKGFSFNMIIRNRPTTPRRGNEPLAQGNALGSRQWDNRPERAKALKENNAFALSGRGQRLYPTQGVALGYELVGLSGHCQIYADNHSFNTIDR